MPTLILWGEQDVALIPELAGWSLEFCDQGRLVRFPEATHWVQHDEPERVTARLLDFFEEARQ
jgi:epoxide hydrolase 4